MNGVPSRRWMLVGAGGGLALLLGLAWHMSPHALTGTRQFRYQDRFAAGSMTEWEVYGGNWLLIGDSLTNDSDDTGAKVVTGKDAPSDLAMDADVRLSSSFGDAGLIVRVSNPEEGTNAFNGYYAGIRLPNQLLLSRMDFGFTPLRRVTISSGVAAGTWYHLRLTVQGCRIAAEASDLDGQKLAHADVTDEGACPGYGRFAEGRFGLRSFAAGGSWRNVQVRAVP